MNKTDIIHSLNEVEASGLFQQPKACGPESLNDDRFNKRESDHYFRVNKVSNKTQNQEAAGGATKLQSDTS